MKATSFRLEVDCPTCLTGTYEIGGLIEPPDQGVGLRGPWVDFDREAVRIGEHGGCPESVAVDALGDRESLAEDVVENERRR